MPDLVIVGLGAAVVGYLLGRSRLAPYPSGIWRPETIRPEGYTVPPSAPRPPPPRTGTGAHPPRGGSGVPRPVSTAPGGSGQSAPGET